MRLDMREPIAIAGFFLSGVAALIYEVCWIREASYVFGSTLYAVSTVVAVFFLGLALGSEIAGRFAQRTRQPPSPENSVAAMDVADHGLR